MPRSLLFFPPRLPSSRTLSCFPFRYHAIGTFLIWAGAAFDPTAAAAAAALAPPAGAQEALVTEVRMQLQVVEMQQVALAQRKNQLEQMLLQLQGGGVAGAGMLGGGSRDSSRLLCSSATPL